MHSLGKDRFIDKLFVSLKKKSMTSWERRLVVDFSKKVADEDYLTLDIDFTTVDLRDAGGNYAANTSAQVLRIKSSESDSLRLDQSCLSGTAGYITNDVETDEIYLMDNASTAANLPIVEVFYVDSNNDVAIAGNITADGVDCSFAYVDFQDTRDTDVQFWLTNATGATYAYKGLNITTQPSELPGGGAWATGMYDNISILIHNSSAAGGWFDWLGITANTEEATDLLYTSALMGAQLGTQDEDLRTQYGIIIKDPETHCADDDLQLLIPGDAVRAKVTIGAYGATGAGIVDEVTTPDEVATVTDGSILVGGPAANKYTAEKMGVTFPTYGSDLGWSDGYCYIKELSGVTVVAGWDAADTDACVDEYIAGTRSHDGVLA